MSDQNIFSGPPLWCANAVATPQGWANNTTGEILVQVGGNFLTRPEYLAFFPDIPNGFSLLLGTDGAILLGADGAQLYGVT